jgi:hypothetical protein
VDQVMQVEPYRSARTVYWVVDNGSSHAGKTSVKRMSDAYSNVRLIHLPVHASWLNPIEIYFSIVQRKALTPNDFATLPELARHLMDFGQHVAYSPPSRPSSKPPALLLRVPLVLVSRLPLGRVVAVMAVGWRTGLGVKRSFELTGVKEDPAAHPALVHQNPISLVAAHLAPALRADQRQCCSHL